MEQVSAKEELRQHLTERMGEVTEHRAVKWLEELDRASRRSAKERLLQRLEEVPEEIATKWLRELDARLCWQRYRQEHDDFCFGVGFGECEDCEPSEGHEGCPNYEYCKEEFEAEWPVEKT
jgi:hypothetical protein